MRDQGIADGHARASVSGLGVCDVWRLELSAEQWPWLANELEGVRGPLEEELWHARARQAVDSPFATPRSHNPKVAGHCRVCAKMVPGTRV